MKFFVSEKLLNYNLEIIFLEFTNFERTVKCLIVFTTFTKSLVLETKTNKMMVLSKRMMN